MRKIILYIPLIIVLMNTASAGQLSKIPVLFSHFLEHHKLNNHIGFLDFLSMHYWGEDLNDKDQDRDMQLPFKSSSQHCCQQITSVPVSVVSIDHHYFHPSKPLQPILEDSFYLNTSTSSLFRPPRI
ncbi:MAG TPA: hypothetical protein VK166_01580 [Chitinophagaceae bacterium]|nr:hypothetical protein [Chitinophagaceae bacterium]